MENVLWVLQTFKESNAFITSQCLLKSHLSCLAIYIYFVLNSTQYSGRKNWKCDSEELFE